MATLKYGTEGGHPLHTVRRV